MLVRVIGVDQLIFADGVLGEVQFLSVDFV